MEKSKKNPIEVYNHAWKKQAKGLLRIAFKKNKKTPKNLLTKK